MAETQPVVKRAVLIGINYEGTSSALAGCINDTKNLKAMLVTHYGYKESNITVLTDRSDIKPTAQNIMKTLWTEAVATQRMHVTELFISYSGHGSYVTDTSGEENDGRDEVFCPVDYATAGVIRDDSIHEMLNQIHPETHVVMLCDQCHSGTSCDLRYRYIGGKKFVTENKTCEVKGNVIAISGCMDSQTAADAWGLNDVREFSGAMTSSFLYALGHLNYQVTCFALLSYMRDYLQGHNFSQVPQLSCNRLLNHCTIFSLARKEAPFLTTS